MFIKKNCNLWNGDGSFSFFSGLGFLDLGFEEVGFQIEFVNEKNKEFLDSYKYARRNKNKTPKYGYYCESTTNLLNDEIWESIFGSQTSRQIGFIGGPPCPDFSVAGKNKGFSGINGQLTSDYIALILKRRPAFFLFENVKGLYKTQKHREYYEVLKQNLKKQDILYLMELLIHWNMVFPSIEID